MLQQTQVKTVIPYWDRWMSWFPGVEHLATASEEKILKAWEGLGYYSRARNLQRAARVILTQYHGIFPREFDRILELPGIGPYTAGAISSIAFGDPRPILDGNVARVLSRLFAVSGPIKDAITRKNLWKLSALLVAATNNASALNQGLMELGALVCTPSEPHCGNCPLRRHCSAKNQGRVSHFPEKVEAPPMRERQFVTFIIRRGAAVLVRKRGNGGVNAGLWEFPNLEMHADQDAASALKTMGWNLTPFKTIKHTITRNRITLRAFVGDAGCQPKNGALRTHLKNDLQPELRAEWKPLAALDQLPFSSAHARLRALLQAGYPFLVRTNNAKYGPRRLSKQEV